MCSNIGVGTDKIKYLNGRKQLDKLITQSFRTKVYDYVNNLLHSIYKPLTLNK